jgi:hypothetical protein
MEKAARLHSEQAQTVEHFQLAEQKAVSANYALIEVMEKKADLEDKERYLRGVEIALSKQRILIEERKQIIASEEAGLRHEKARLLDAKSAIEQEKSSIDDEKRMLIQEKQQALTAATTALVAVDEESLSLEEGTFMTLEEAEYLTKKVTAAAKAQQYEAYVSTELQDVATVEQNVVALYETRRVTPLSRHQYPQVQHH